MANQAPGWSSKSLGIVACASLVLLISIMTSCAYSAPATGPFYVDSEYYSSSPAPSPGSCPHGTSNASLTLQVTQGPYYVEEQLLRADITEGEAGVPLALRVTILDPECNPVKGAWVDIWHANATGFYSQYTSVLPGGTFTRRKLQDTYFMDGTVEPTDNTTFLRGTVETDSNGLAEFYSIVPGWYKGRVPHIHAMVHLPDSTAGSALQQYEDSHVAHTAQYYFEDSLLDKVYSLPPYNSHIGTREQFANDFFFASGGSDTTQLFTITYKESGNIADGLIGSVTSIVDPNADYSVGFNIKEARGVEASIAPGTMPPRTSAGTLDPTWLFG